MAEAAASRPIPKPSVYVDTKPFWDGAKQGKLVCSSVWTPNSSSTIRGRSVFSPAVAIWNGAR